jgi:ketosteroid isomerase-like protein
MTKPDEQTIAREAVRIRVHSTMNEHQQGRHRSYAATTRVVAVMEDGEEIELRSVVSARWEHTVRDAPRLVVTFGADVELDAEAPAPRPEAQPEAPRTQAQTAAEDALRKDYGRAKRRATEPEGLVVDVDGEAVAAALALSTFGCCLPVRVE